MSDSRMTYRFGTIAVSVLIWEVIFWILFYIATSALGVFSGSGATSKFMFKSPENLNYLFVLIPIAALFFYNLWKYNQLVGSKQPKLARSFMRSASSFNAFMKYFFFRNAVTFLIITLAQPVFGTRKISGTSESLELVVCLDVSSSMNTMDISSENSRLDISKRALIQLVNNLHGERLGICLFANSAFVQLPVTRDYGAAKLFINEIETNMISSQGTNIDAALNTAMSMFSEDAKTAKGIIVVTDGENHESNPTAVLKEIKEKKVQLSVLGIGTVNGGLIPKDPKRPELGYKKTAAGRSVVSKLNERFIKDLAAQGGGYANITSSEFPDLSALLTQINHMKRTKIDNLDFDIQKEQYQITLFIAVLFWLIYLLWTRDMFNKKSLG